MDLISIIKDMCMYPNEQEWFEFKTNWFDADALGEYISALSNVATLLGRKHAYFVWGIEDENHTIVGTEFNHHRNYKEEPLQNYLARNLSPSINFKFEEVIFDEKRLVVLVIPASINMPVSFKEKRYIRIGSSKVNLNKFPEREKELFYIVNHGYPTIVNTPSDYQDLTFDKLFIYYATKGIKLSKKTFKNNLGLLTDDGKYNIMAQLLSDNSHIPLRLSIFAGKTKAARLVSVNELGFECILLSLDELFRYGKTLNIPQADERNRFIERKEVPLFDDEAYREAVINAMLHNSWIYKNEPMISVFSDRIEIVSRGGIPPRQTFDEFFTGKSIPVNEKLAEIFLQLHISEKSGRGVPKIVEVYGKEAYKFEEHNIMVTIPFNWLDFNEEKEKNETKKITAKLSKNRIKILEEMKKNPYITKKELSEKIGITKTPIDRSISFLKEHNYIERIGSDKDGYWKVNDK